MSGSDGKRIRRRHRVSASRETRPRPSTMMSVVDGVSFAHTGTRDTSFTACVTMEMTRDSLPMFEPSPCDHGAERRGSPRGHRRPRLTGFASVCSGQLAVVARARHDRRDEDREGCAFLIARFAESTSRASCRRSAPSSTMNGPRARPLFHREIQDSGVAARKAVLGPATFTTGCRPMVFVTTPPHPASNARRMFDSDSVGGAEASRNGFSNRRPVNETANSVPIMQSRKQPQYI